MALGRNQQSKRVSRNSNRTGHSQQQSQSCYELLDNYVCWVGAMNNEDSRNLISRATSTATASPSDSDIRAILIRLTEKGVCSQSETGWCVSGDLLASFVAETKGRGRGRIWLDDQTEEIYQGQTLVQI